MEEEPESIILNPLLGAGESSDSDKPGSLPPSVRFKGVVLQQNGKWGAQIYTSKQRTWLGTFTSESSAALAYDRAATVLRPSGPHLNFPSLTPAELGFQDLHTVNQVLAMIRDGSYDSKLADFLRAAGGACCDELDRRGPGSACRRPPARSSFVGRALFQKELTPSDVGKLNRLVVPKKHAMQHFPPIETVGKERDGEQGGGMEIGMVLELEDAEDDSHSWEFRYCYWKSSQSFVFTRGWNRFVKAKKLQAGDVVTFYRRGGEVDATGTTFLIGVRRGGVDRGHGSYAAAEGGTGGGGLGGEHGEVEEGEAAGQPSKSGFRLFGVQISWT